LRISTLDAIPHLTYNSPMATPSKNTMDTKNDPRQKIKTRNWAVRSLLILAGAGILGCAALATMLKLENDKRNSDTIFFTQQIDLLQTNHQAELEANQQIKQQAEEKAREAEAKAKAVQQSADAREKKNQAQLVSLGVANDHLIAWMMRDHSKDLPELHKSTTSRDILVHELNEFLKMTDDNGQFQAVRARIMMQLAELEIYQGKPVEADQLLDSAEAAWADAGIKEPGHAYRIARARLACLIQALDQQKSDLATKLLPKARKAAKATPANDSVENKRLGAVLHVIDGRMIQSKDPAKALKHFQSAIKDMQGIQRTLTEHIIVRSDLARYKLEAANLAENLHKVDDADRLRDEAAVTLEKLLKTNPELQLPKVQLAEIKIQSASADIRSGNDTNGAKKLSEAEALLATLPSDDATPNGPAMQVAAAKGLRAVLLRDAGKNSEAQSMLNDAIALTEKIITAQKEQKGETYEPLYRLSVLHWQLAGLIGDSGNKSAELIQGQKAANLMEDLLKKDIGTRDNAIRRGLGYLYGDLGHTAAQQGNNHAASTHFKHAATIWQSLINKYGQQEEYTDGLKWSQTRQSELNNKK